MRWSDWWSEVHYRVRALFSRRAMERELEDEVAFHLTLEAEKQERLGMSPADARREARLAFGGVERVKEESREGRGIAAIDTLWRDIRFAWRGIRRRPGFTLAVVFTLGLGIGANGAMFSVIDRLMFRAPEYLRDPAQVNRVYLVTNQDGREDVSGAYQYTRFLDLSRWSSSFAAVAAHAPRRLAVGNGPEAREMSIGAVSASYFAFFDAAPTIGRFFGPTEDTVPVGAAVAVLSYPYWQTAFGGRADVLGQSLKIDRAVYTIIGVAPRGFSGVDFAETPAAWIPITTYAGIFRAANPSSYYTRYNWGWMQMLVRRKPGVSVASAGADLTTAFRRSHLAEAAVHTGIPPIEVVKPRAVAASVLEGRGPMAGLEAKVALWIGGVSVAVLLIGCANVANLLFGRSLARRREIAVRLAMGVGRGQLLRQLLTESVLLGLLGGAAGIGLAHWGARALQALFLPPNVAATVLGDGRTLVFALVVSIVAGVVTGLVPALSAGREDLTISLKSGQREGSYRPSRLRAGLLVFQAALSVVLLVGAGLFVRSLQHAKSLRLGYDIDPVLVIARENRSVRLSDSAAARLNERLEAAARLLPEVSSVSRALTVPLYDTWTTDLHVDGIDSVRRLGLFTLQAGSEDFFTTAGTRIVRGRGFSSTDRAQSPRVAVVSEAMAAVLWPGRDALGQCMRIEADTMPCTTVVGIAEDMRQNNLTERPGYTYYLAIDQYHPEGAYLFVRTKGDAVRVAEAVRRALQPLLPGDAYLTAVPFRQIVDPQLRSWSSGATMFVAFGGLALLLAAVGLYSVVGYDVSRRTQEMGIRVALGADRRALVRLVVSGGVRLALVGVGIGTIVALVVAGPVRPILFQQSPYDPVVFGVVIVMLLGASVVASLVPAVRAARLDPNTALRAD